MDFLLRLAQYNPAEINCKTFPPACFKNFTDVSKILMPSIYLGALLLMLFFGIKAAYGYITSQGDPKALETSRNTIVFSFLGVLLIFLAFFLTRLVGYFFHIDLLL